MIFVSPYTVGNEYSMKYLEVFHEICEITDTYFKYNEFSDSSSTIVSPLSHASLRSIFTLKYVQNSD